MILINAGGQPAWLDSASAAPAPSPPIPRVPFAGSGRFFRRGQIFGAQMVDSSFNTIAIDHRLRARTDPISAALDALLDR